MLAAHFLFREQPRLSRSLAFFLPGTCEGRGFQRSEMSEFSPAVNPRSSLSPYREISPVLFTCPDQHPSAAVSDLVSFVGSDDGELDNSLSLAASYAEELGGSYNDPTPRILRSPVHPACILSNAVEELGLEWSPPEEPSRSRLNEWSLPGAP